MISDFAGEHVVIGVTAPRSILPSDVNRETKEEKPHQSWNAEDHHPHLRRGDDRFAKVMKGEEAEGSRSEKEEDGDEDPSGEVEQEGEVSGLAREVDVAREEGHQQEDQGRQHD